MAAAFSIGCGEGRKALEEGASRSLLLTCGPLDEQQHKLIKHCIGWQLDGLEQHTTRTSGRQHQPIGGYIP